LGERAAVPKVLPLLHDANGFVRSAAAEALGKLGDRSAVPSLVTLLVGVETSGIDTNIFFQDPNSPLAQRLKLTQVEQKNAVAIALGELRSTEAVDPLIQHGLKSQNLSIQATAAYSLGQIGDRRAVTPLQDAVRTYYNTLSQMDPSGFVINDGTAPVADTRKRDREKESRVRAAVVWALGQIGDPAADVMLKRALNDDNSLVRDNAVEAISKIQERQARAQRPLSAPSAPPPDKSRSASAARTP
jgi:HEAT repeat protein